MAQWLAPRAADVECHGFNDLAKYIQYVLSQNKIILFTEVNKNTFWAHR